MNAREYRQHRQVTRLQLLHTTAIVGLVCFVAGAFASSYAHLIGALLAPIVSLQVH